MLAAQPVPTPKCTVQTECAPIVTASKAHNQQTLVAGGAELTYEITPATPAERDKLAALPVFSGSSRSLARKVQRGDVLIAKEVEDGQIIGFLIAELYGFFDENTVSLVVVDNYCRRRGVGTSMVHAAERIFGRGKLFMATNASNTPMRQLCDKLGYKEVGRIQVQDENDPEVIYLKRLETKA